MITISKPLPPLGEDSDDRPLSSPASLGWHPMPDDIFTWVHGEEADSPPLPDPAAESQPFPIHCLPEAAGAMAREIGRVTTAQNEPLAAASVLGILSAGVGAGLEMNTGGERRTRGNLYILTIADSGTGKGETHALSAAPFEAAEAEAIQNFEMRTKPGLIAELRVGELRAKKLCADAAKESDQHARHLVTEEYRRAAEEVVQTQRKIDSAPRYKVADITKEAFAIVMQGQAGEAVASLSSEARGIFSIVKGRYGKEGGDEDFYCSAYSGDSLTVDRVGRPRVTLRRPCLSVHWMVQPDAARKAFAEESFTESGLLPRFLFFDPKAEPQERTEQPAPISAAVKSAWADLIRSLVSSYRMQGNNPQFIAVSRNALVILTDYERENVRRRRRTGDLRDIASFVARWTENGWRIALVLHAAKHGSNAHLSELTATTAEHAVEIMRWFSDRQLEILSSGRQEKMKKRLIALNTLLVESHGEISFGKLSHSHGFEDAEIRQLHSMFPSALTLEKRKPEMGRPHWMAIRKQ
jgi:replicative DNA helicase